MLQHFNMTTWENPTKHKQVFQLHSGPGADPVQIELDPGGSASVPSMYDDAIRTERDGVVVGGLAPMLVPKGREQIPVHDAIARAAALGDSERRLVAATGASAGGVSIDAVVALEQKNRELEAKVEALMAMMAERTAPAGAPEKPVVKPQQGPQGAPPKS